MNHNSPSMFKDFCVLITTTIIIFFPFFIQKVLSSVVVHPKFQACEPQNCGNGPNITYPFRISARQDEICGYPGFEVTCNNSEPVFLGMPGNDYIIKNIYFNNQSFRVVSSSGVVNQTCPVPLQNFTLLSPFKFGPDVLNLVFFYNCSVSHFNSNVPYPVPCLTNTTHSSFAVFVPRGQLKYFNNSEFNCERLVDVPVDAEGDVSLQTKQERNYTKYLENGFTLEWTLRNNCNECQESGGRCGFDKNIFACFCFDRPHSKSCNENVAGHEKSYIGKLGIGTGIVGFLIVIAVIILCYLRRKHSSNNSMKKTKNGPNVEAFLKNPGTVALKRYKYSDVKKMTNSFKEKLGQGGYGGVFKGKLLDGCMVAVKVLSETKGNGEEFINEVASISRTSHVNIVTLLGFCIEGLKRALIYEFMPNGSLEKFIYDDNVVNKHPHLGWEMLYKIAIGIARGLEYLHRGCNTRILHFDIKPHNILLDQDFCPKISDFGLAKLCLVKDSIVSMTGARGTPGYIAPELVSRNFGGVSHKSDVYSYGMMVLEMVGGRKNMDVGASNSSKIYFPQWIYRRIDLGEDLGLHGITSMEDEIAKKMILVGLWCIQINPLNRPPMHRVLEMLEQNIADIQIPPKPFMSSPSREQEPCSSREEECSSSTWQPL